MQCCTISAERRESAQNNRTMLRSVATHLAPEHPAERMCTSRLIESARKPRLAQSHQIRAEARATAGSLKRMRTRPTVESCEETTKCHAIETASPFLSMWLPQADSAPQTTTHGLTSNQKKRHAARERPSTIERSGAACCQCYNIGDEKTGKSTQRSDRGAFAVAVGTEHRPHQIYA